MNAKSQVNFYLILNVSPHADIKEIKSAYLRLAKIYHPDKNKGNKLAEKKFRQINFAWEALKDPERRKAFDEWLKAKTKRAVSSKPKPPSPVSVEKPIHLAVSLKVSVEDICQSRSRTVRYFRPVNGVQKKSSLQIEIPQAARQGSKLRFKGQGGAEGTKSFGDLYVRLELAPHKIFQIIEGGDILVVRPVPFTQAVEGGKIDVPSPYGALALRLPPACKNKQLLKARGQGLPKGKDKGDLFVKILIDYPAKQSEQIKKQLKSLSLQQQKVYAKKYKTGGLVYPKVLKFQKKVQELMARRFK